MKQILFYGIILLLLSCSGSPANEKAATANVIDEQKTKAVFEHHLKAFMNQDIEAIMADYTEESFLVSADSTYSGLNAIRNGFIATFKDIPKGSSVIQNTKMIVKKDVAYLIWKVKTPKADLNFATDTFIIQNGKIIRQTFAAP